MPNKFQNSTVKNVLEFADVNELAWIALRQKETNSKTTPIGSRASYFLKKVPFSF